MTPAHALKLAFCAFVISGSTVVAKISDTHDSAHFLSRTVSAHDRSSTLTPVVNVVIESTAEQSPPRAFKQLADDVIIKGAHRM